MLGCKYMQSQKSCWFYTQHIHVYIKYVLNLAALLTSMAVWLFRPPVFLTWITAKLPKRFLCSSTLGPWSSILNMEARYFLKHNLFYSSSQEPAIMPHITQSKSESLPELCDWLPTTPTYFLQSHPLPLPPNTHLFQPHLSLLALTYTRNAPTFRPLFWLFLLPWNFLQLDVYLANQFMSFRLLFRCYILSRFIQTTNVMWQFIGFHALLFLFFPRLLSPSALDNIFILRFVVYFASGDVSFMRL